MNPHYCVKYLWMNPEETGQPPVSRIVEVLHARNIIFNVGETYVRSLYHSCHPISPPMYVPTEARGVRGIAASFSCHIFSDSSMSGAGARPEHPFLGVARLLQREPPRRPTRLCDPRGPCHEVARRGVAGEGGGNVLRGRLAPLFLKTK